jgi:hypothetical protein
MPYIGEHIHAREYYKKLSQNGTLFGLFVAGALFR